MTTPVRIQQSIRQLETKGLTHTQIARELGVSRTTVVKYATRDYSPVPPTGELRAVPRSRASTRARPTNGSRPTGACHANSGTPPGAYTSGSWRNAASRAVIRRCSDGSSAGANATAARPRGSVSWNGRRAARRSISAGPGRGRRRGTDRAFLVVSFPYSNMRYVAALPGETAECVCHGLNKVFSHAGMVPRVLVFDNATGSATAGPTGPSPRRGCSRCSARTTASRRGSATPIPAGRREARRTRSVSCAAT